MSQFRSETDKAFDDRLARFGKALFTRQFWKAVWALVACFYFVVFVPFVSVPRQLFFTGGGHRGAPIVALVIAIYVIFWIAVESPTLAGDTLFLIGFILVGKAIWELIAALRRQRGQAWEKRWEPGVSLLAPLGIRSEAATFGIAATIGLIVTPFALGHFIGPILVIGGIGGALTVVVVGAQQRLDANRIRQRDFVMRARADMQQRILEGPSGQEFQEVDIG